MKDPGFRIIDNFLSHEECDRILEVLNRRQSGSSRAGARNLMKIHEIRQLAADRRLARVAKEIMGSEMYPFKAILFEKIGKANWLVAFHQDTALPLRMRTDSEGWGPHSVKKGVIFAHAPTAALSKVLALRIHLDASHDQNGPLRVIPSSHLKRITDDDEFKRVVQRATEVKCLVTKGGIIAMSPLIIHASSKSLQDHPRRVLHIEFTTSIEVDDGVFLATA